MNEKSYRYRYLSVILLLIIFFAQILDDYFLHKEILEIRNYVKLIKNGVCLISIAIWGILLLTKRHSFSSMKFFNETKLIYKLAGSFLAISGYFILKNGNFTTNTIINIVKLILPVTVAFCVSNFLNLKDIIKCMKIYLIACFVFYVFAIGIENITIENFLSISYLNSYCPFESDAFSPQSIAFVLFFMYYRENRFYTILSFVFNFMTFKRIMVPVAILLYIVGRYVKSNKEVNKTLLIITKIGFIALVYFYIMLCNGDFDSILNKLVGRGIDSLTMGRSWRFRNYLDAANTAFGWGSLDTYTRDNYNSFEMDLLMFYLELTILGVIFAVHYLLELGRKNMYCYMLMVFTLLEMLTSHWFDITYYWVVLYITIAYITEFQEKSEVHRGKKYVFKWKGKAA